MPDIKTMHQLVERALDLAAEDPKVRATTPETVRAQVEQTAKVMVDAYKGKALDRAQRMEQGQPDRLFHRLVRIEVERLLSDRSV